MKLLSDKATTLSPRGGRRGMALLLVLTSVAVLTTLVVEFAYDTRVDASIAANARDELRAHYMARSATNLARMLLSFQHRLDGQLNGGAGGPAGGSLSNMMPKIRLWDLIPIESGAINTFVGAVSGGGSEDDVPLAPTSPAPGEAIPAAGLRTFGSYEGGFVAEVQDEETKINLNKLNALGPEAQAAMIQLGMLVQDEKWNFLFDEENSHGERWTREEIFIHMRDWIDDNEAETAIDRATGQLADGFGDEVSPYTRYRPSYEPKNALFDSLDEVYQVAGITDSVMAAFGDQLTVWPDINSELNINTSDPRQQLVIILLMAEDTAVPALMRDPLKLKLVLDEWQLARMLGPFMGLKVQNLVQILEGAGVPVKPEIKHNPAQNNFVGDTSKTFKIVATGQAGDVTRRMVTVIRYDEGLGKLLYYREE